MGFQCSFLTGAREEAVISSLRSEVNAMTKDVKGMQKQAEVDAKNVLDLIRERDILTKNVST